MTAKDIQRFADDHPGSINVKLIVRLHFQRDQHPGAVLDRLQIFLRDEEHSGAMVSYDCVEEA